MSLQGSVNDFKAYVELLIENRDTVIDASRSTLRSANRALGAGFQDLVEHETTSARAIYATTLRSIDKARSDGIAAVVSNPAGYLPPTEPFSDALSTSVGIISKTSDTVVRIVRKGFESLDAELRGTPTPAAPKKRGMRKPKVALSTDTPAEVVTKVKRAARKAAKKVAAAAEEADSWSAAKTVVAKAAKAPAKKSASKRAAKKAAAAPAAE